MDAALRSPAPLRRTLRWASVAAAVGLIAALAGVTASAVTLPAPMGPGVDPGEILLGELHCTACHAAPAPVTQRLGSGGAPRLGSDGLRLAPQGLVTWLANPSGMKPGTSMPHALHGLSADRQKEAAEALAQYLVSIQPAGEASGVSADPARAEKGRILYHTIGCVACHAPFEALESGADTLRKAQENAVPLGDLSRKYPAGELVRFLRNPVAHRVGGRMPDLGLSESEAIDIATYLLRDQMAAAATAAVAPVPGLKWEFVQGNFSRCRQLAEATPTASGVTDQITTSVVKGDSNFGLRFRGMIAIPASGDYEFWLNSDDGSQLWIDGKVVVDNDNTHAPQTKQGKVRLEAGRHPFEFLFFQGGGGYELTVQWEGPGQKRGPIPSSVFTHEARPLVPVGSGPWVADASKIAQGKEWFGKLGCSSCHAGTDVAPRPARPLLELASRSSKGCLADAPSANAPRFDLTPAQRQALRTTVANVADLQKSRPAAVEVAATLTQLNCYACHARDGIGGPNASGHGDWFKVVGEADLGDEGRIPPLLNAVGAKLKTEWLSKVLHEGVKVRPYMATRMPRFGDANAKHLHAALLAADRSQGLAPAPAVTDRDVKLGWKLVGRDGLSCIACHTFTTYGSMGIPALALDTMGSRLEWDWFRRYLPDPAALRPGTRMPTFWPEGHAVNRDILGGDTDAQIRAIWAYLSGGAKAEVPAGLVRGRRELVAHHEPEIYRNFIDGVGSRAIGVGYPQHANLAFDAEQLRLAMIWQGSFIDTARHSTDRGVGFEPPLGDHRVSLPKGPAFAPLATANAPWPETVSQKFRGYRFDAARQPIFLYSIGGVRVADAFVPKPGELDMTFVRTLTVEGSASQPLWFRAAKGKISRKPDGGFLVDDVLTLRFRGGDAEVVGDELRVRVPVPGVVVEELNW